MYATRQNMIDRFGEQEIIQLTDREDPPAGVIDDTVLDQALKDSEATINTYLAGRYALPLAVVPQSLERVSCDLARYYLYDNQPTDAVKKKHDDALALLKSIARGEIRLGIDAADKAAPVVGTPQASAPERQFTKDKLKDFGE